MNRWCVSGARCASRPTPCGAQGSLVLAALRPSHARERPQRSVRLGSVRTRGKPEGKGWERKIRRSRPPGQLLAAPLPFSDS